MMTRPGFILALLCAVAAAQDCSKPLLTPSCCVDTAPAAFDAEFVTTAGNFTLHIERVWAPLGVDRALRVPA
jgi:hypothetical protein